jgi:hypothetical protein
MHKCDVAYTSLLLSCVETKSGPVWVRMLYYRGGCVAGSEIVWYIQQGARLLAAMPRVSIVP